jgi:hypothetical protein
MHKYLKILLLVLIIFLASGCTKAADDVAIYSLLLDKNPEGYIKGTPLVIRNQTVLHGATHDEKLFQSAPSLDKETLTNFLTTNITDPDSNLVFSLDKPHKFISPTELSSLIIRDDWTNFSKKFPDTHVITSFSKIGFNRDANQALVYMEQYCGSKCGVGNLYFLVREKDEWKLQSKITIWIP